MTDNDSRMTMLRREGFSLLELLLAATAGLVVLGVAAGTLADLRSGFARQQDASTRQQDARIGLAILASELRLAGVGTTRAGRPLLTADPSALSFVANLSHRSTQLTQPLLEQDSVLAVQNGQGWPQGKPVVLCAWSRCAQGRLARDGRRHALDLTGELGQRFPPGSQVLLANRIRYYFQPGGAGLGRLMRMVDGGFSTLVDEVAWLRFTYFGPRGTLADEDGGISRVRIELATGLKAEVIHQDVAVGL